MSYTYLQEQGEESSAESFSDIGVYARLRLSPIDVPCYFSGRGMDCCLGFPYGMICEPSMESRGGEKLMSCAREAHAKDSQPAGTCLDCSTNEVDLRSMLLEPLARWDQESCSWRMSQQSLFLDWGESLVRWPEWGITSGPDLWALTAPAWSTCANDFGWLRTPCKSDGRKWYVSGFTASKRLEDGRQPMLIHQLIEYHGLKKGWANPEFWELMMDWPIGWTDLNPLETAKFQQWLSSHGKH